MNTQPTYNPATGFLSAHPCRHCGKPLEGQDQGHPAELYAGTYTGLCDNCTEAPAVPVKRYLLDGCLVWSHPPSCSSYRRSREEFYAYEMCQKCRGKGVLFHSGGLRTADWYEQCPDCMARYVDHPTRRAASVLAETQHKRARSIAEVVWAKRLKAAGYDVRKNRRGMAVIHSRGDLSAISTPILDRFERIITRIWQRYHRANPWVPA